MFNTNKVILNDVEEILTTSSTPEEDLFSYLTHRQHLDNISENNIKNFIKVIVERYKIDDNIFDDTILTTLDNIIRRFSEC